MTHHITLSESERLELLDLLTLARDELEVPTVGSTGLRNAVVYQCAALNISHKKMQGAL